MKKFRYWGKRKTGRKEPALKRLTFRIDEKHLEELEAYAQKEGMTNSFLVRHLVIRFLESQRKPTSFPPIGA